MAKLHFCLERRKLVRLRRLGFCAHPFAGPLHGTIEFPGQMHCVIVCFVIPIRCKIKQQGVRTCVQVAKHTTRQTIACVKIGGLLFLSS